MFQLEKYRGAWNNCFPHKDAPKLIFSKKILHYYYYHLTFLFLLKFGSYLKYMGEIINVMAAVDWIVYLFCDKSMTDLTKITFELRMMGIGLISIYFGRIWRLKQSQITFLFIGGASTPIILQELSHATSLCVSLNLF